MKKISVIFLLILLCACMRAPFVPPVGAISSVQAPLNLELDNTQTSSKKGSSSAYNILGLVSMGDLSYDTAAKNGNISIIKYADYEHINIFFLFQKITVNVYGE